MVNWDKPIRKKGGRQPLRFVGRFNDPTHPIILAEEYDNDVDGRSECIVLCEENGKSDGWGCVENIPEPRLVSCTNYYPASPTSKKHVHKYDFEDAMRGRDIDVPGYNITVTELDGVYTIKLTAWNMAIAQGEEL